VGVGRGLEGAGVGVGRAADSRPPVPLVPRTLSDEVATAKPIAPNVHNNRRRVGSFMSMVNKGIGRFTVTPGCFTQNGRRRQATVTDVPTVG